jgi:hypothetical protein
MTTADDLDEIMKKTKDIENNNPKDENNNELFNNDEKE